MSRLALVVFLVLVVAVSYRSFGGAETGTGSLTLAQPAPNVGQDAPDFTVETLNKGTFNLDKNHIYVLTFWSPLNKGSDEALPEFTELAREFQGSRASFVAVYLNSVPKNQEDAPYTVIRDSSGRLASLYNVKQVPRLFLIRDGKIAMVQNGYYEGNRDQLKKALKRMLAKSDRRSG